MRMKTRMRTRMRLRTRDEVEVENSRQVKIENLIKTDVISAINNKLIDSMDILSYLDVRQKEILNKNLKTTLMVIQSAHKTD